jgi:CDP-glycerol glycerophosphotransferase
MFPRLLYWSVLRRKLIQACVDRFPKWNHAIVAGFPDDEGNAVEVVRSLPERWAGKVYWLVDNEPSSLLWLLEGGVKTEHVHLVSKRSLRAFLLFATARLVFFTHGIYTCPRPPTNAVFVNLWHGDGPKSRGNAKFKQTIPTTFIISGTLLWGLNRLKSFDLRNEQLLVTGNPRIDQFARPASDLAMRNLGIDPAKPFILWMPTYRGTNGTGRLSWNDTSLLSSRNSVRLVLQEAATRARELGITMVVKPHPLDADSFTEAGMRVVTSAELLKAQVALYQLLARSAGLITDYSSVWTDYLALSRPIGFYCPDYSDYVEGRGLNVDELPSLLPGPMLTSPDQFTEFFLACSTGSESLNAMREESIRRTGAETRMGAARRLLDALMEPSSRVALHSRHDFGAVRADLLCGDKKR